MNDVPSHNSGRDDHITYDPAYRVVQPDDFPAMIEVDRYAQRSDAFDEIISQTHDHFWDPNNPAYLDYGQPWDLDNEFLMPPERFAEFRSAVADKLDKRHHPRLANELMRWNLSNILHGEQGALSLSASLCDILHDPGAQEYASNQAREEARHVAGFGKYVAVRWGKPLPVGEELGRFLNEIVLSPVVYKKLVGMQMLLEGLAMGAFANLHAHTRDPLLKRLVQLVMTDEAFHHKFGKIWADRTMPKLTAEEHIRVEDWAAYSFETLLFNLSNVRQRRHIYAQFGLDWEWVRDAIREVYSDEQRRKDLKENNSVFRVLVKTLLKCGIITDRTSHVYGVWIDMKGLAAESDEMVGDAIAAEGIEFLRGVNRNRKVIGQKPLAAA
ncbi:ferritin-like domain-containing protein [Desertibaculum subflavum]|uniref:ferritin-like domain-containing protein n=1 Tax=Desertibaculum subflavum TaxID=2268458 RepID=UPI000E6664A9